MGLYNWAIPAIEDILIFDRGMISLIKDVKNQIQNDGKKDHNPSIISKYREVNYHV